VATKGKVDFVLVEVGGTVGEYENLLFLETARVMKLRMPGKVLFMLVSYIPIPKMVGEMKTKPTQHAVRSLNYSGIQPDIIIARASKSLDSVRKRKISDFCNVAEQDVISAPDIQGSIYEIPVNFEKDNLGKIILKKLGLASKKRNFGNWNKMVDKIKNSSKPVKIGIVGKYFNTGDFVLADSYISVIEAVKHAAWSQNLKPDITWLDAEQYEKSSNWRTKIKELTEYDGIIVPGGFGKRGIEGKIRAINFSRIKNIPFLGLCYGLQLAVIEFARNVCKMNGAHTTEINPRAKYPVICTMAEQIEKIKDKDMGGSMRLGSYLCELNSKSLSRKLYDIDKITERHRHRYEVNNSYVKNFQSKGMLVAGINSKENLVEIIELPKHKFFVATQFHPEFKSRPLSPHPLFVGLIKAASEVK